MLMLRILWGVLCRAVGRRPVPVLDYYKAQHGCPYCIVAHRGRAEFVSVLSMPGSVPRVHLICGWHAKHEAESHRRSGHVVRSTPHPSEFN